MATIFGAMTTRRGELISIALLLALTLAMFGDLLVANDARVAGSAAADLFLQFVSWRDFGFRELAKGNLALWNPYIFGGAPYLGGMQAALLYPPNWLFLLLPLPAAVNWTIALHVFAIGVFMFCWMKVRGLQTIPSFFAGVLVMFCGAYFLRVFAGHLPHLLVIAWIPLIFCSVDGLFETGNLRWSFVGMFAVAMQLFAGHPQYFFYTAVIAGFYAALRLIGRWNWSLVAALLAMYPGGAALSAVQLLPAYQAMQETVRGVPLSFRFASSLAFPPENFITLLLPNFFGEAATYWGRGGNLWEASLFIGATGFTLALYAILYCERKTKWIPLTVLCATLILALGVHTPLYRFLYAFVPGFNKFRCISKFVSLASIFLSLMAAMGLDRLLRQKKAEATFVGVVFALALVLALAGFWVAETKFWPSLMDGVYRTHESRMSSAVDPASEFTARAQHAAATSLALAAGTCALLGTLLASAKREGRVLCVIVVLAVAEMFWFARVARPTFDSRIVVNREEKSFLNEHPGDYRILNRFTPDTAMSIGVPDIWGYDPSIVRRYAEFLAWSQGADPDKVTQEENFTWADPLFSMLRLRYIILPVPGNFQAVELETPTLPHAVFVSKYRIAKDRDAIFGALRSPHFDPRAEVILESEPAPRPSPGENDGSVQITASSTDSLTIEASVTHPVILLITDVYTPSWRAISLPGSVQSKYQLLPANYILRAVPLVAGHHRLRVEYFSRALQIGKWISIASLVLLLGAVYQLRQKKCT